MSLEGAKWQGISTDLQPPPTLGGRFLARSQVVSLFCH